LASPPNPKKTLQIGAQARLSDGREFLIHPEDVLEAHKRDLAAGGSGLEIIKRKTNAYWGLRLEQSWNCLRALAIEKSQDCPSDDSAT
jgi:hypothetical protein